MLTLSFVDRDGVPGICELADRIWHECYPGIITEEQIDYMVSRFQSEEAVLAQMDEKGYRYAFLVEDGRTVGYTAVSPQKDKLFLSKLYITAENRGRGLGTESLRAVIEYAASLGKKFIYLTVNKNNEAGIRAYEHVGFKRIQSITTDIGEGFVMDDYVMELVI